MVTTRRFSPDGQPLNKPTETLAEQISWLKAQILFNESMGTSAICAKAIASHRQKIADLLQQEVG